MRVAVVTDSTATLPAGLASARGVTVVPLTAVINGVEGAEGGGARRRGAGDHAVLRRHAGVPASRWADQRGGGAARYRFVRQAHPARRGRGDRGAGQGPDRRAGVGPARRPGGRGGRGRGGRP